MIDTVAEPALGHAPAQERTPWWAQQPSLPFWTAGYQIYWPRKIPITANGKVATRNLFSRISNMLP